jgi:hypothetical protein
MEIKIKGFIASKKSELYIDCADNYAINIEHNKFAISDGVSKSFFPKIWSDILTNKYVNQKDWNDDEFIIESQKDWHIKIDEIVSQPETKWFTKSQYNRKDPALATFVGLQFLESEQKWNAQALGDSFLFFIPKDSTEIEIELSSKLEPIIFDNFPDYLSSIGNSHKGEKKLIKGEKIKEGTFYLMTDALAEWFLQNTELAIPKLKNIQNQEQFLVTIEDERITNRLNDDDSAVLVIEILEDGKKEFHYSDEKKVTFLSGLIKLQKEEIEESKKKEISSQDSLNVNQIKEEEELPKEEDSENKEIEQVEQSSENISSDDENLDEKITDDESEGFVENLSENIERSENKNISEEKKEEETSSEQTQNVIPENPKIKSIFDKF